MSFFFFFFLFFAFRGYIEFCNPSLLLSWMFEHDCLDTCCLGVLYAYVLYFHVCTFSMLGMFHMERHSRNTIIIVIIIAI